MKKPQKNMDSLNDKANWSDLRLDPSTKIMQNRVLPTKQVSSFSMLKFPQQKPSLLEIFFHIPGKVRQQTPMANPILFEKPFVQWNSGKRLAQKSPIARLSLKFHAWHNLNKNPGNWTNGIASKWWARWKMYLQLLFFGVIFRYLMLNFWGTKNS